jgi:hypothetical protein
MTRETKLGIAIAGSFLCLLGALIAHRLWQGDSSSASTDAVVSSDDGTAKGSLPKSGPVTPDKKQPASGGSTGTNANPPKAISGVIPVVATELAPGQQKGKQPAATAQKKPAGTTMPIPPVSSSLPNTNPESQDNTPAPGAHPTVPGGADNDNSEPQEAPPVPPTAESKQNADGNDTDNEKMLRELAKQKLQAELKNKSGGTSTGALAIGLAMGGVVPLADVSVQLAQNGPASGTPLPAPPVPLAAPQGGLPAVPAPPAPAGPEQTPDGKPPQPPVLPEAPTKPEPSPASGTPGFPGPDVSKTAPSAAGPGGGSAAAPIVLPPPDKLLENKSSNKGPKDGPTGVTSGQKENTPEAEKKDTHIPPVPPAPPDNTKNTSPAMPPPPPPPATGKNDLPTPSTGTKDANMPPPPDVPPASVPDKKMTNDSEPPALPVPTTKRPESQPTPVPAGGPAEHTLPMDKGITVPHNPGGAGPMPAPPPVGGAPAGNEPATAGVGAAFKNQTSPVSVPSPNSSGIVVRDMDATRVLCDSNALTFEELSQKYCGSKKYAQALLQFNRDTLALPGVRQNPPRLKPNDPILIPSNDYLENHYPKAFTGLTPLPSTPPITVPTAPPSGLLPVSGNSVPTTPGGVPAPPGTIAPPVKISTNNRPPSAPPGQFLPGNAQGTGGVYTVGPRGAYLYEIARDRLGDGRRWAEIWRLNPQLPHDQPVAAGTQVRLPVGARSE